MTSGIKSIDGSLLLLLVLPSPVAVENLFTFPLILLVERGGRGTLDV